MKKYEGKLISAFETNEEESTLNNINEIHYLEFTNIEQFTNYKKDPELLGMSELRNKAILNTKIYVSKKVKNYA